MREVSVRMLHLSVDLARAGGIDEAALVAGLPSLALRNGKPPDWIDWDDFAEMFERLERMVGGPDDLARVARLALPTAYPELRALGAIFESPMTLFTFVEMRLKPTWFRHIEVEELDRFAAGRIRWRETIPAPHRACEAFLRASRAFARMIPMHLDLPEAQVEITLLTPRSAEYLATFQPPEPLAARAAHAISAATALITAQLDEAFTRIAESLRAERATAIAGAAPPALRGWAEKLALTPRQQDVFALLMEGRANKEIASALRCSERNVEFHAGRIFRAAYVTSRAELLVKVLRTPT